jgi:tripartite-type tricarboxylate transporter receptor subunit TctC
MSRRTALTGLAFAIAIAAGSGATAQDFPTRPVTLVVPYPAGGATDVALRTLASATEKHLGQSIVIENRGGAAGTLGPAQVASAKPDGYTISQIPAAVFRYPFLRKTSFDPTRDFTYIIGITGYAFGIVVKADAPWKTLRDFLDDARATPGKINFGSTGANTSQHITMLQIAKQQGIMWTHIPFKGSAEAINALLGGHIQADADSTGWAPQVNAGQFRLLVTWGSNRTKSWPSVPTLKESGIDLVVESPYGLAGPKNMDPNVVKILHDAFKKGMHDPLFTSIMRTLDQDIIYMSSADYRDFALKQIGEEKRAVEELGLKEE